MSRIAVILDDMFYDSEYTEPVKAFKNAGHEVTVVGLERGKSVKGKKEGTSVKVDISVKEANVQDFDALLIPGGYSPDILRAYPEAVDFVRGFIDSKVVFAICHGPQLLISAQALKGRKVTCWKSIIQDVKNAGAEYADQEVVEDANLITSRQPSDIPVFIERSLAKLKRTPELELPSCESTATGEQARMFEEQGPCKEQDI